MWPWLLHKQTRETHSRLPVCGIHPSCKIIPRWARSQGSSMRLNRRFIKRFCRRIIWCVYFDSTPLQLTHPIQPADFNTESGRCYRTWPEETHGRDKLPSRNGEINRELFQKRCDWAANSIGLDSCVGRFKRQYISISCCWKEGGRSVSFFNRIDLWCITYFFESERKTLCKKNY